MKRLHSFIDGKSAEIFQTHTTIYLQYDPCIYIQVFFPGNQRLKRVFSASTNKSRSFLLATYERFLSVSLGLRITLSLENDAPKTFILLES